MTIDEKRRKLIKEKIYEYMSTGNTDNLKRCFNLLFDNEDAYKFNTDDLIHLNARYEKYKTDSRTGVLSNEQEGREISKINKTLLYYANNMEGDIDDDFLIKNSQSNKLFFPVFKIETNNYIYLVADKSIEAAIIKIITTTHDLDINATETKMIYKGETPKIIETFKR